MIIVPELKTVFVLVPRTGTGSLYRELQRAYPKSMLLYRHMEADGVPQGYDRWKRIGFVRHPLARLRSLYTFMGKWERSATTQDPMEAARIRAQVEGKSFEEWLLKNDQPFTKPYSLTGEERWWPTLARRNAAPENKLSQFSYLRPDLGTEVRKFEDLESSMAEWGLDPQFVKNRTSANQISTELTPAAEQHIQRYCAWDLQQECRYV